MLPLSYYSDESSHIPLKVSIFAKVHEMRSTVQQLTQIAELPSQQKAAWLSENEDMLQTLLDVITQQAPVHFEEPDMDAEMMKLLMEYTLVLQDLMAVVQSIFTVQKKKKKKTS